MRKAALVLLAAAVIFARFSQTDVLWVEEAYPIAAAREVLRGKVLYRDIWFDKPPLYALVYLLWGSATGAALRWAGAIFTGIAAALFGRFALEAWGRREALIAAALASIYLSFGIPAAVMALAPDLLSVVPQVAAVWLAWRRQAFASGVLAGIAFLFNAKAAILAPVCLLWAWPALLPFAAGWLAPNVIAAGVLAATGALGAYWEQVWSWGALYSADTFVANPLAEGLRRTLNWAGFHAAAVVGAGFFAWRKREWRWAAWVMLAAVGVVAGFRFFPRYYFLLLPPVVLMGAAGIAGMKRACGAAVLALALIPVVRFAPRHAKLWAGDRTWADLAMNEDSRRAGTAVRTLARPGDNLLVWGYRPDVFVYAGLPAASRFLDSQPLTGVIADRHLTDSRVSAPEIAARNRQELSRTAPVFIVDGLGPYNPALAITRYFDLSGYREVGRTTGSVIYQRLSPAPLGLPLAEKR